MKRLITVFGVCVCMLAPAAAFGQPSHTWTGKSIPSSSGPWIDADGWSGGSNWPGHTSSLGDTALIADATYQPQVDVAGTVDNDVYYVEVNAGTADADMALKIATNGDLDVLNSGAGYVRLVAGDHDVDGTIQADDAMLWYAAGDFDVDDLDLDGGTRNSTRGDRGLAIVDWDVARTIVDDVDVTGDVDFDAAADITVSGDFNIGNGTIEADMDKQSAGDVTVTGKIIIKGGTSADTIVTVSAGCLQTS